MKFLKDVPLVNSPTGQPTLILIDESTGLEHRIAISDLLAQVAFTGDYDDLANKLTTTDVINLILGNPSGARAALGLGNSATRNVGTTAGTVAAGDHTHDASDIAYNPDDPADWSGSPGQAAEAIDELAERVKDIEDNPVSVDNATVNAAISANPGATRGVLGLGNSATRNIGATAGTVAAGDDIRLSNARTPTAHASSHHTGGSDALAPSDIGAADANHVHDAEDITFTPDTPGDWDTPPSDVDEALNELADRVSTEESRTPTNAEVNAAIGTNASASRSALGLGNSATRNVGTTAGTVAAGDDARLSNARTPTAHAASHHTGGSDALTPSDIGAADANHVHDADEVTYTPTTGGDWDGAPAEVEAALDELAGRDRGSVKLSGNQTISGVKTFSASPVVPTPTTSGQAANKGYVDNITSPYPGFLYERMVDGGNPSDSFPNAGKFSFDQPGVGSVTEIKISVLDAQGGSAGIAWAGMKAGDVLYFNTDTTTANFKVVSVDTSMMISGGRVIIAVTATNGTAKNVGELHGIFYTPVGEQGIKGDPGDDGNPFGLKYTHTSLLSPSSGEINVEGSFSISKTTKDLADASSYISFWGNASSSSVNGHIQVTHLTDPTIYKVFSYTGTAVDMGSYYLLGGLSLVSSNGTFANGDEVNVSFVAKGDMGDRFGFRYTFSDFSGDPSFAQVRIDGGDIKIHTQDATGNSTLTDVITVAESGASTIKGLLSLDNGTEMFYIPIASISDNFSGKTLTPYGSATLPTWTLGTIVVNFIPSGDKGDIGTAFPVGAIVAMPAEITTPPTDWLVLDGSGILISAYQNLCNLIYCGDANNATAAWGYKAVDSTGTVRSTSGSYLILPDYRNRYIRGFDSGNLYQYLATTTQNHAHSISSGSASNTQGGGGAARVTFVAANTGAPISLSGESRPPSVIATFIIYAGP